MKPILKNCRLASGLSDVGRLFFAFFCQFSRETRADSGIFRSRDNLRMGLL